MTILINWTEFWIYLIHGPMRFAKFTLKGSFRTAQNEFSQSQSGLMETTNQKVTLQETSFRKIEK